MKKTIKACGYIRVSSPSQATEDKTSPEQQRESIQRYAENEGWDFIKCYEDLGISGSKMIGRVGLQQLLDDALTGKFQKVIVDKLDRFGRNTEDILRNRRELSDCGVALVLVTEVIDNSYDGDLFFTMKSGITQWEKDRINERFLTGRVAVLKNGGASVGQLPYGRYYEKVLIKGKMRRDYSQGIKLDEEKANMIRDAAKKYLAGESLLKLAKTIPSNSSRGNGFIARKTLMIILQEQCGDKWEITYNAHEKIEKLKEVTNVTLPMPRILDDITIQKIKNQARFNKKFEKGKQLANFPLSGYLKCGTCDHAYSGQSQHQGKYRYYRHGGTEYTKCPVTYVKADVIENAVFQTIFEQTHDIEGFRKAIKDSLPDPDYINSLKAKIEAGKYQQAEKTRQYNRLVGKITSGVLLDDNVLQAAQSELQATIAKIDRDIEEATTKLSSLPSLEQTEQDAYEIRLGLLDFYGSPDRLKEMSFNEKKELLHNLFHGHDSEIDRNYGIYVTKKGKAVEMELLADIFWGSKVVTDYNSKNTIH